MTRWLSMLSIYPRAQAIGHVNFSSCGHMFRPDNSDGPQHIWNSRGCMWPRLGQSVCSISFVTVIDWFREGYMTQTGPMKHELRFLLEPLEKRSTYGEKTALLRGWKPRVAAGHLVTRWKWTKPTQSPKEINPNGNHPEYALEGLMLRLKLQYSGHLMRRANSWKRPWCWERLKVGGERDNRGWDGWMASPTQWTWVWVSSGSWWGTGRPGVLQSMGSQRVGHDWVTELN